MIKREVTLKKYFVKQAIVMLVTVTFIAGLTMLLANYVEEYATESQSKEGEINAARTKLANLKKEHDNISKESGLYETYSKQHNTDFSLNREVATKWIVEQREKYHLVNLSITISPFSDVSQDMFPLKTGTLIKSEMKLTFGSFTDNSAYAFLEKLQREMPGIIKVTDIKITRNAELSSNALLEIKNHRITPLVNTEITLSWFGIRLKDAKGGANAK